jgi:hypothetical protein
MAKMNNAELIKALRWCGSEDERHEMCVDESYSCPMWNEDRMTEYCKADLMLAAADLIEAQEKRIAELEAQLPKEGEWIDDNGANVPLDRDGYTTGMCRCSVCNDWLIASDEYEVRGRYCPSCGSRMAKGEQE